MSMPGIARKRSERGSTLTEFAIVSIVFFATVFGIVEFGLAVWQYSLVADLAQEGARWASVRGTNAPAGMFGKLGTIVSEHVAPSVPVVGSQPISSYVRSRALGLSVGVDAVSQPHGVGADAVCQSPVPGCWVEVKVSVDFTPLTALLPNATLRLQSTARSIFSQ